MASSSAPNAILNSTWCSLGFQISIEESSIRGTSGLLSLLPEDNGIAAFEKPEFADAVLSRCLG
jgi:hypothetical protein